MQSTATICSCRIYRVSLNRAFPDGIAIPDVCVLDLTLAACNPMKYQGHKKIVVGSGCCI